MTIEELQQKAIRLFNPGKDFEGSQSKGVSELAMIYSIDDLDRAMTEFKAINKRQNFFEFKKNPGRWIEKLRKVVEVDIRDKRAAYILDSIQDVIEYKIQARYNNPNITNSKNRSNYKMIDKETCEKLNKTFKSFTVLHTGEIIIKDQLEAILVQMVKDWSWLSVGEFCLEWIKQVNIVEVIRLVLCNLFFDSWDYWKRDFMILFCDYELINSLIIAAYNEKKNPDIKYNEALIKIGINSD